MSSSQALLSRRDQEADRDGSRNILIFVGNVDPKLRLFDRFINIRLRFLIYIYIYRLNNLNTLKNDR